MSSSSLLLAQDEKNNQDQLTLQQAIEFIESESDYIFNYDPVLLEGYSFIGEINISVIDKVLDQVFYSTPFNYEIDDKTILVYYPSPQIYRICGTLIDMLTQEPLVAANITMVDSILGTQSDLSGYFEFECKADKNQKIEISYLGYQTIRFSLQDTKNKDCLKWGMEIDENVFGGEIIISDYLLDGISLGEEFTAFHLDFDQLSKSHSNVEHDVLKTAQLLPGINSIDDSASNLQIRGSNPGQNLVLWEGVPLYNSGHVFGMISAINPFSIENVSIYKGAYDPKYDNRVGGILDISLSDDLKGDFRGSVGTSFTELHSNFSIPILKERLTLQIAGRQSINEIFNSPTLKSYTDKVFQFSIIDEQKNFSNPIRTEQTLAYSDWNAKLLYRPFDRLMVNGGFYRNAQDFNYLFEPNEDPILSEDKIDLSTQIVSLETTVKITNDWSSKLSLYQSAYDNAYYKSQSENAVVLNSNDQINSIEEQSATFSNDLRLGSKLKMNFGYEYNVKDVRLDLGEDIDFDVEFIPIEFERARFHNLFQSISYTNKNLQIDAGNRSGYYQELNSWFHSPRINLRYALNKNLILKADAGIYHQFISQITNVGAYQIKVDNPLWILNAAGESLSQTANKLSAGFLYQKGKWLFDVDTYYNLTSNISTVSPQLQVITEENGFSKGSSKVFGLDLLLKKRWNAHYNTWLSYSLGFADYDFADISENSFTAPNDIRHNLSFVNSYRYRNFQLSLNSTYHSGLPYSQASLTFNEEDPDAEYPFLYFRSYDSFNSQRLNAYIRLDLSAAYRFDFNRIEGSQLEISCSILNILGRKNYVAREYYVEYDEATDVYSLPYIQKALLSRTALVLVRFYW